MTRQEVSSPTVSVELTAVIEAEEGRDVATWDIPNVFTQTQDGILVDIICELDPSFL